MYVIIQQLLVPIGTAWGQVREDLSSSSSHLIELTIVSKQVLMQERV